MGLLSSSSSGAAARPRPAVRDHRLAERTGAPGHEDPRRSGKESRYPAAGAGWTGGKPKRASRAGSANTVIRAMAVLVAVSTTIP